MVALMIGLPTMAHATISNLSGVDATANTNVATTSFVRGAYNAMATAVNTAIGQANTDIAAKQDQLTAGGNNVSATVKTTVGDATGANAATDTALVTEKAVRDAIDDAKSATTYTQGSGISISNNEISASGITTSNIAANAGIVKTQLAQGVQDSLGLADSAVQSVTTGESNGTIKVDGTAVSVYGLGDAAYTNASAYATAAQGAKADTAVQSVTTGESNGTIKVDGTAVSVYGLGDAAYTNASAYATAAQGTKADNADTHIGDMSNLTGTATTLVGAIEEVRTAAGNAGNKVLPVYGTWNSDSSTGNATLTDAPAQQEP